MAEMLLLVLTLWTSLILACSCSAAIFSAVALGLLSVLVEPELSTSEPPERPPFIFISRVNLAIRSFCDWRLSTLDTLGREMEVADVSK